MNCLRNPQVMFGLMLAHAVLSNSVVLGENAKCYGKCVGFSVEDKPGRWNLWALYECIHCQSLDHSVFPEQIASCSKPRPGLIDFATGKPVVPAYWVRSPDAYNGPYPKFKAGIDPCPAGSNNAGSENDGTHITHTVFDVGSIPFLDAEVQVMGNYLDVSLTVDDEGNIEKWGFRNESRYARFPSIPESQYKLTQTAAAIEENGRDIGVEFRQRVQLTDAGGHLFDKEIEDLSLPSWFERQLRSELASLFPDMIYCPTVTSDIIVRVYADGRIVEEINHGDDEGDPRVKNRWERFAYEKMVFDAGVWSGVKDFGIQFFTQPTPAEQLATGAIDLPEYVVRSNAVAGPALGFFESVVEIPRTLRGFENAVMYNDQFGAGRLLGQELAAEGASLLFGKAIARIGKRPTTVPSTISRRLSADKDLPKRPATWRQSRGDNLSCGELCSKPLPHSRPQNAPPFTGVSARAAKAAREVLQKRISDVPILRKHWDAAGEAARTKPNFSTCENATKTYQRHRDRFWRRVKKDSEARKIFEDAGFAWEGTALAPVYPGLEGRFGKLSLEHTKPRRSHPTLATDPSNLQFLIMGDNTILDTLKRGLRQHAPDWGH